MLSAKEARARMISFDDEADELYTAAMTKIAGQVATASRTQTQTLIRIFSDSERALHTVKDRLITHLCNDLGYWMEQPVMLDEDDDLDSDYDYGMQFILKWGQA